MALTNKFIEQVSSLSARGVELSTKAHAVGQYAVKAAYANGDLDPSQYLMDNLPKYMQNAMFSWLKRAGLDIAKPEAGSARYTVIQVIDQKRQAKAFQFIESTPVLATEHIVTKDKTVKPLEGTVAERLQKAVHSMVSRLKERDPETAALLNDIYASENQSFKSCLFHEDGAYEILDQAELEVVRGVLNMRRNIAA